MNKKYLTILFNPLFICVYSLGLYVLYRFFYLGNVKKRVPILIVIFLLLLVWIVGWTIYYKKHKNMTIQLIKHGAVYFVIEIIALLVITGYSGYRIYQVAQPFTGKLGNYLYERENSKGVLLIHNNYLSTGLQGILEDIGKEISLPEKIYVSNYVEVVYDKDGFIHSIYAFLYGKDNNNDTHSYLISFDIKKSRTITVYLDGYTKTAFNESDMFSRMIKTTTQDENGMFHVKWKKDKTLQNEENTKVIEKHKAGELIKDTNGDLHYYLEKDKVYSLIVVDAALGSRAYRFVGLNIVNEDPFHGELGVATDIHFDDENNGYIVLNNTAGDHPRKYITNDGGKTFQLVQ